MSYQVQTEDEVAEDMDGTITDAAKQMELSPVQTRTLLANKKWNLDDLVKDMLEPSARSAALREAGILGNGTGTRKKVLEDSTAALIAAHARAANENENDGNGSVSGSADQGQDQDQGGAENSTKDGDTNATSAAGVEPADAPLPELEEVGLLMGFCLLLFV